MPPRSSWKGFIKLSLVSVPVKAYTASATGSEIRLNQLHGECNSRVKYQKICPTHGQLKGEDIVSGYEFSKGQYVVIDLEELNKLRKESDKSVQIDGFVPAGTVDPIYHSGRTYYLVPDGPVGQKPYALLLEGMRQRGVEAVAEVVVAGKEQLVLLRPHESVLAMTVLNYQERVKATAAFDDEIVDSPYAEEEMTLTNTLINASMMAEFDFGKYKDNYVANLSSLIETKIDGKEIVAVTEAEEPKILNLMEALKASVAQARLEGDEAPAEEPKKKGKATTRKKMARSATKRESQSSGSKRKSG